MNVDEENSTHSPKMKGEYQVLKEFLWKTFENTGSIEPYMLFREIEQKKMSVHDMNLAEEETATSQQHT